MSVGDTRRRVCLLTGAGGRLGSYFAALYAGEYDFAGVYRRNRPWSAAQDAVFFDPLADPSKSTDLAENSRPMLALQADLVQLGECEAVVAAALEHYGRIDLVVNAAAASVWGPLATERVAKSARAQLVTNVAVPLELTEALVRLSWESDPEANRAAGRNIVNVASSAALRLYPGSGQGAYAASKAALVTLTTHMAAELSSLGVRANAVAPTSFPSLISTESVARTIAELDRSSSTGTLVELEVDARRDHLLLPAPAASPAG